MPDARDPLPPAPRVVVSHTAPGQLEGAVARAFAAGVPAGWVTVDEDYGQSKLLLVFMEEHDQPHVVATRRNDDVVTTPG